MIIRLNPQCIITVQTNATILSDRAKDALNRGNFQIGISLDSLNKTTYEAIRLNANYDKVMDNIKWFSEYSRKKNSYFMLALCVMRQNWNEMPAFINLCNKMGATAVFHKVWFPAEYALHNLPFAQLQNIYNDLKSFSYHPQNALQKQNIEHYNYFLSVIRSWMEEAHIREENISADAKISISELLSLVLQRIDNHIDSMNVGEQEKSLLHDACREKLPRIIRMFEPSEQESILRMLYVENPARIVGPLKQQTEEMLYTNARKILPRGEISLR